MRKLTIAFRVPVVATNSFISLNERTQYNHDQLKHGDDMVCACVHHITAGDHDKSNFLKELTPLMVDNFVMTFSVS